MRLIEFNTGDDELYLIPMQHIVFVTPCYQEGTLIQAKIRTVCGIELEVIEDYYWIRDALK